MSEGTTADVLADDEVCACLHETGERKTRVYERCRRCGAFMEADYLVEEWRAAEERAEKLEAALREIAAMHAVDYWVLSDARECAEAALAAAPEETQ